MRISLAAIVLCLTVAPVCASGQVGAPAATGPNTPAAPADFDGFIAETLRQWNVPGVAIAVVKDGQVVLAKGYGSRDPATGKPMTKDTIVPIASMSKAFTSFGAALLVDEGKMSFDAPVIGYLPGFALKDPAASSGLTLRDMLSHRSGMPRHDAIWYHNGPLMPDQLVGRMVYLEPSAPFRSKWQYNNNMFVLSGLAVGKISGRGFERFLEERIFHPLDMDRTTFSPERARADANHMGGVEILNGKRINVPMFKNTAILNAAGGVYSTADDLANWMLVHLSDGKFMNKQIVQPTTLADMHNTHMVTGATVRDPEMVPIGYGLGWFTNMYRGHRMVSHGGNLNGVSTLVALLPEQRLGVTVLVNHGSSELRDALTKAVLDRFLGATGKDWTAEALARKTASETSEIAARANKGGSRVLNTRPSHALADYAGNYSDPGYGSLTISLRGNQLAGRYNDDSSAFSHWHYDVFDAATDDVESIWLDSRVQFVTDLAGRISAAQVVMEPSVAPIVFKKQPDAKLSDPKYLRTLTGTYELGGTPIAISVAGQDLVYLSRGGTPAKLIASLGSEFVHPQRRDARIAFKTDTSGRAQAMTITDSSGVYEAKRID